MVRIDFWMQLHLLFWNKMQLQQYISVEIFIISDELFASGILRNVLTLNQPINWIVTNELLLQHLIEQVFLIGWGGFKVGSISNPGDKIATDLGIKLKTITDNITATGVISANDPRLVISSCFLQFGIKMAIFFIAPWTVWNFCS